MNKEDISKIVEEMKKKQEEYINYLKENYGSKWKEEYRRRELDRQQRDYEENNK